MNLIKMISLRMIRVLKAFFLADMNMGTSYLESILGKEHSLAHVLHYMPGLQNLPTTL